MVSRATIHAAVGFLLCWFAAAKAANVSADVFTHGMVVTHPEYGPGKIVSLSGSGRNRKATVQFAMVGEKSFVFCKRINVGADANRKVSEL